MKKILIVDDEVTICQLLSKFLTNKGFTVETAGSGARAVEILKNDIFDLVLCDYRLGDTDGEELLLKIKALNPNAAVIIITGYSDIKIAVKVIKLGAFDYVTKPLFPDEILHTIKRALDTSDVDEVNFHPIKTKIKSGNGFQDSSGQFVIGDSPSIKEIYKQIDLVAPTNYSVIIFGESGTGKESIARSIHEKSPRKDQPFVAMDCGSLSKELAGSEFFGHEKGSFTGAFATKIGHFELANGGTLFLDEVGNLSYEIQALLLRVVQERKVKKIGGTKELDLDVRIIVASNENLQEAFQKGKFREDLFHRFNEFAMTLPPLRERGNDILAFADFFLHEAKTDLGRNVEGFSAEVRESFLNYQWPGNIREMKNVIRRACLLSDGNLVESKSLPSEIINFSKFQFVTEDRSDRAPNLKATAMEAEFETILKVLKQVNYNKTKAATILNIDRKTLYNKMKAFNL